MDRRLGGSLLLVAVLLVFIFSLGSSVSADLAFPTSYGMLAGSATPASPTAPPAPTFSDVPPGHPYFYAIEDMAAAGVILGYGAGDVREFRPDARATRAQFAKMITLSLGFDVTEEDVCAFVDVPQGEPGNLFPDHYIAVAAKSQITRGYDASHFNPDGMVTRAQLVTMAVRAASAVSAPLKPAPSDFGTLGNFSAAHSPQMSQAEYEVLLAGLAGFGPRWDPWMPASRGEVAEVLWRLRNVVLAGSAHSPADILQELQDQTLDGAYRRDELQAFLDDPGAREGAGPHAVRLVRETLRDHPRFGRILFDGDSLTAGSGAKTAYPLRLMATWPRPIPWKNIAIGGETLERMLENAPRTVDPFYTRGNWRNVVVLWAGTNDIALWNHATATIYGELRQYCVDRRAHGFTVVVLTLLPRSDSAVQAVPDFEARRQELNQLIRSQWEGFADLLVDIGADDRIGQAGDEGSLTYYTVDRVHLNDNGQQLVADVVGAALRHLDDWAGILN